MFMNSPEFQLLGRGGMEFQNATGTGEGKEFPPEIQLLSIKVCPDDCPWGCDISSVRVGLFWSD